MSNLRKQSFSQLVLPENVFQESQSEATKTQFNERQRNLRCNLTKIVNESDSELRAKKL